MQPAPPSPSPIRSHPTRHHTNSPSDPPATMVDEETQPLIPKPNLNASLPAISQELDGYISMLSSAAFHATMTFLVHVASLTFHFSTISSVLVRAMVSTSFSFLYLLRNVDFVTEIKSLTARQWLILAARGIFGSFSAFCQYSALSLIPVGDAVTIFFCNPVITILLSAVFLRERLTRFHMLAAMMSFVGIAFVSQPSFLQFGPSATLHPGLDPSQRPLGVAMALIGATCASTSFVLVKSLGTRVHYMFHVLAYGLSCAILCMFIAKGSNFSELVTNGNGAMLNFLSAGAGFGSQSLLDRGLQRCRAGPGTVVRSLSVPFSFLLGLLFLSERPSVVGCLGVVLVFVAVGAVGMKEMLRQDSKRQSLPTE